MYLTINFEIDKIVLITKIMITTFIKILIIIITTA